MCIQKSQIRYKRKWDSVHISPCQGYVRCHFTVIINNLLLLLII